MHVYLDTYEMQLNKYQSLYSHASADVDYMASEVTTLLFLPGDATPQCAYITIVDDTILEYTEHFSVHLDTTDYYYHYDYYYYHYVKFDYKYATVNIIDNDCKFCNVTVKVSRYCTIDLMHKH